MKAFTFNGEKVNIEKDITIGEYIKKRKLSDKVIVCKVNGEIVPSDYMIGDNDCVIPLTIAADEGYLIYKESLILLFLHAAEQIDGVHAVFVRQSVNKSTYFEIEETENKKLLAEEIKNKMHSIIASDEEFRSINYR